ncbi:MAG: hypothetical protein ACYCXG_08815 [Acidiferrobacter sp.]
MMASPTLMFIIERGGYPVCADQLASDGYRTIMARSMRKALVLLKSVRPDIVVAEFNFGPRYGDRISNLEPLLAQLQATYSSARVIALADHEYRSHLGTLARFAIFDILTHPVTEDRLLGAVRRAAGVQRPEGATDNRPLKT